MKVPFSAPHLPGSNNHTSLSKAPEAAIWLPWGTAKAAVIVLCLFTSKPSHTQPSASSVITPVAGAAPRVILDKQVMFIYSV